MDKLMDTDIWKKYPIFMLNKGLTNAWHITGPQWIYYLTVEVAST